MKQMFALRGLVAALALAAASLALAETVEETRIAVQSDGKTEVVRVGEMQVGEVRAIVTEGGTPAVLTRTESGLRLEVNNKIHEIEYANLGDLSEGLALEHDEAHADGDGKRIVKIVRQHGEPGDAAHDEAEFAEALALAEAENAEPGKDRVVVVRTVRKVH